MMRRLAYATVAAATTLTVLAGPASAQTYRHSDPSRDVLDVDMSTQTERINRQIRTSDITKVKVGYTRHNARVSMKMRAYGKAMEQLSFVEIYTSDAKRYRAALQTSQSYGGAYLEDEAGDDVVCAGFRFTPNYRKALVSLKVPTSCLGGARWIKVSAYTLSVMEYTAPPPRSQREGSRFGVEELAEAYADAGSISALSRRLNGNSNVHLRVDDALRKGLTMEQEPKVSRRIRR